MSSVSRRSERSPVGGGVRSRSRRAARKECPAVAPSKGFVFKVALKRRPVIWRRIAARGDHALHDLHAAIFAAFDREEEHLYSFYLPKVGTRGHDWLRTAIEYTHPFAAQPNPLGEKQPDASKARLDRLRLRVVQNSEYLFDIGDSWRHEVTVEGVTAPLLEDGPASVLERHGDSPPQYPDPDSDG